MLLPIQQRYGIRHGFMTTVHSYTNDQRVLDSAHPDLRRARAAGLSMIPTKTGASVAIGLVMPELQGKIHGMAVRVPTPNVSLVDLTLELVEPATALEINQLYQDRVDRNLDYTEEPLVSMDFLVDGHSAIVDGSFTRSFGTSVKILGWYNNEWGYANRLLDLIRHMTATERK
jgi:glyceraldehyde 3-phosphate dehydrogenase